MLLDLRSLLETAAANTYQGEIACQSTVAATCSGPVHVVEEDSRDWVRLKRHGQAFPAGAHARVRVGRVGTSAGAQVDVIGTRAVARLGKVTARGQAKPGVGYAAPAHVKVGRVSISAGAQVEVTGHRARATAGHVTGSADAFAVARGVKGRARIGRVGVEVGPDLELLELEELLLLEVA